MTAATFSLLGTDVAVAGDDEALVAGLASVYGSVPTGKGSRSLSVRIDGSRLTTAAGDDGDDVWSAQLDSAAGRTVGVGVGRSGAGASSAFGLFHWVARLATEHMVLHAAVVEREGQATVLVAPSRVGKTTLAIRLAMRGARFLSDEAAPIDRRTGLILPVPRSVGLRPGPIADDPRLADAIAAGFTVFERGRRAKAVVDLVASGLVEPGRAATARHVVLLGVGEADEAAPICDWLLDVDRPSGELLRDLRGVEGIVSVEAAGEQGAPSLRIRARREARLSRAIDELSAAHGVTVIRLVSDALLCPDYDAKPEIEELRAGQGLLALGRHLENGAGSPLLVDELGGSSARLMMELGAALSGTRFWRLNLGRIDDMCELVEGLP